MPSIGHKIRMLIYFDSGCILEYVYICTIVLFCFASSSSSTAVLYNKLGCYFSSSINIFNTETGSVTLMSSPHGAVESQSRAISSHRLYLDKLLAAPHLPISPLSDGTTKDILPSLKYTGVRNKFEAMPPRPVDSDGYITQDYLRASKGTAQSLARCLLKIESRRYVPDRRYGKKFDQWYKNKKQQSDKTTAMLLDEQSRLAEDFTPSVFEAEEAPRGNFPAAETSKPARRIRELKVRPKNICSKESLINCILDATVITVEPKRFEDPHMSSSGHSELPPSAGKWSAHAMAIARGTGTVDGAISETGTSRYVRPETNNHLRQNDEY